jgi:EAL domain-containing protein (putative c-di-GMP-specific phosphodiesterase class I)
LFVSLNVSPVQLRQPDFASRVVELLDRQECDPRSVVFEVTETVLVDDGDRSTATIERLRAEGFRLALDDFGSGLCSLNHLQRQPVDLLKIDPDAIAELGVDPHGPTLARTILQTAAALDLHTVAEGIETDRQLEELRRQGCDLGQGRLLSEPLEADALAVRFGVPPLVAHAG